MTLRSADPFPLVASLATVIVVQILIAVTGLKVTVTASDPPGATVPLVGLAVNTVAPFGYVEENEILLTVRVLLPVLVMVITTE